MTPEEDSKITKKQKRIETLSWLLAVPIGLLVTSSIVVYKVTFGDGKIFVGEVVYPTILIAIALSAFLVERLYRRHMEQKLGRRIRGEYELTSLNSWMEASRKDSSEPK